MEEKLHISEDGYLLCKSLRKSNLKEVIDVSDVDFNKLITREQIKNAVIDIFSRIPKDNLLKTHYIQQLCGYKPPEAGDVICWYDDLGVLCGSAGYVLIRNGYIERMEAVWRS